MECGPVTAWLSSAHTPPAVYRSPGYSTEMYNIQGQLQACWLGAEVTCISFLPRMNEFLSLHLILVGSLKGERHCQGLLRLFLVTKQLMITIRIIKEEQQVQNSSTYDLAGADGRF